MVRQTRSSELAASLANQVQADLQAENFERAGALAQLGLDIVGERLDTDIRRNLESAQVMARSKAGPVLAIDTSDPRYPALSAQAQWQIGRVQGAWKEYDTEAARALVRDMVSDLNPEFTVWLVREHIRRGKLDEGELLSRNIIAWMDGLTVPLSGSLKSDAMSAKAEVDLAKRNYPVARAQFQFIADNSEFEGQKAQDLSRLQVANIDRITGNIPAAEEVLNKLKRSSDSDIRSRALFQLAQIAYDQEDFKGANELATEASDVGSSTDIAAFLAEVNLKLRNYSMIKGINWGNGTLSDRHVPGKLLEISLKDRNGVIGKRSSTIELRAWTDKGDEEYVTLAMADEKGELYQGQIATLMGDPQSGDGRLQIVGGDQIHYDLSDDFKRKTNYRSGGSSTKQSLQVLSDAELYASSGAIISEAEANRQRMEAMLATADEDTPLSQQRSANQVRPGNPVNLRVVDFDRNRGSEIDSLFVSLSTSSGDRVNSVELKETKPHSGVFEGILPTDRLAAIASASDTADGIDANVLISPSDDLPNWTASFDGGDGRYVNVDLNDLVDLGKLRIRTADQGKPDQLVVQTSLNNTLFKTVAATNPTTSWDGSITAEVMPVVEAFDELDYEIVQRHFGVFALDNRITVGRFTPRSGALDITLDEIKSQAGKLKAPGYRSPDFKTAEKGKRKKNGSDSSLMARVRGGFYLPERRTLRFHASSLLTGTTLFVNGKLVTPVRDAEQVSVDLGKGVHQIELVRHITGRFTSDHFKLDFVTSEAPYHTPVDSSFCNIASQPAYRKNSVVASLQLLLTERVLLPI